MSTHTRWHREKRVAEKNVWRHPADGEAWKHIDEKFDWFPKDPRNIKLGVSTDGFNPFGSMTNAYSMWPFLSFRTTSHHGCACINPTS